jgi:RNA polymerase sigma factor (sigma-70 family)
MIHQKIEPIWAYNLTIKGKELSALATQYFESKSVEFPGDFVRDENNKLIDRRNSLQKELATKVIEGSYNFLYTIAKSVVDGPGWRMPLGQVLRLPVESQHTVDDLVSEASVGIIKRLKNYDPSKGAASTFISYNAAAIMYRAGLDFSGPFRIPVHVHGESTRAILDSDSRNNAIRRIAQNLGVNEGRAASIHAGLTGDAINIDDKVKNNGNNNTSAKWADLYLPDEEAISGLEYVSTEALGDMTQKVLSTLSERQERVLRLRFGIGVLEDKTLEEVGEKLSVTRERIRQIEAKALRHLRHPARSELLRYFT